VADLIPLNMQTETWLLCCMSSLYYQPKNYDLLPINLITIMKFMVCYCAKLFCYIKKVIIYLNFVGYIGQTCYHG